MDMEYAHLDGYFGLEVYNVIYKDGDPEKKPTRYWTPLHGRWVKQTRDNTTYYKREDHPLSPVIMDEQSAGEFKKNKPEMKTAGLPGVYYNEKNSPVGMSVEAVPFLLNDSETDRYEQWKTQLAETEFAMLANPLKLLPLFHYDPRRWQVAANPPGNAYPFEQVGESGLYLGFKMYTAQGYRPYDVDRLPIDNDLWFQMTQVNPYDFYRLDEQIERIARNIVEKRKKEISIKIKKGKEEIEKVLPKLEQEEIDEILDKAAYIRYATQGYIKFKETP